MSSSCRNVDTGLFDVLVVTGGTGGVRIPSMQLNSVPVHWVHSLSYLFVSYAWSSSLYRLLKQMSMTMIFIMVVIAFKLDLQLKMKNQPLLGCTSYYSHRGEPVWWKLCKVHIAVIKWYCRIWETPIEPWIPKDYIAIWNCNTSFKQWNIYNIHPLRENISTR